MKNTTAGNANDSSLPYVGLAAAMAFALATCCVWWCWQLHKRIALLESHAEAINSPSGDAENPYVAYYKAMQDLKRRLEGVPDSGDTSFVTRLSELESRMQKVDGRSAPDKYGFHVPSWSERHGRIGQVEGRVSELEENLEDLLEAVEQRLNRR
jgi:hypothetical protein